MSTEKVTKSESTQPQLEEELSSSAEFSSTFERLFSAASPFLLGLSFLMVQYSLYLMFLGVPADRSLGDVQRILYFHAGSATAAYAAIGMCLFGALMYLSTGNRRWDALQGAAGEVAFLLCTVVFVTGMIWGQSSWNTPFKAEPRLVTFLLLWMNFLGFVLLRGFSQDEYKANHSAVLAILGSVLVPLMIYSIKLLSEHQQLHPEVVAKGGLDDAYKLAFFFTMGSLFVFQLALISLRFRVLNLELNPKREIEHG